VNAGISVFDSVESLSRAAADLIVASMRAALSTKPRFSLVLAGGSTPRCLYRLLAEDDGLRESILWKSVHLFWGDERHVPPDHPRSNYRLAAESLLHRISIPAANIHRIQCEAGDAETAAGQYEKELQSFFQPGPGRFPRFDCVLLGMGTDGHTASLFPGSVALQERRRLVTAAQPPAPGEWRVTLTLPVLNQAGRVLFLVSGAEKAPSLRRVLADDRNADALPAGRVRPHRGRLHWLVDRAAARLL
jgi:6-phosphogluconolactonase